MRLPRISEESAGLVYATGAYALWGLVPLYWVLLDDMSPFELAVHRVLWCALIVAAAAAVRGRLSTIAAILRTPQTVRVLAITSVLISINWGLFTYAVLEHHLIQASLGYYLTPLVSFALGIAFFHERVSRVRIWCIVLATVGVLIQLVAFGRFPWISLVLAVSFGLYGYLRKRAPVAALDGLLVETGFLLPFAVGLVVWWHVQGTGTLFTQGVQRDLLLVFGGAVSALPLALFAAGVRRVRLTTIGFLQYLAPSLSLLLAVFGFNEPFTAGDLASFACIWAAILIVSYEGWRTRVPIT